MKSRGNCLVIEHDHDVRELLAVILTGEGFDVYTFATATEGVLAAQTLDLALVTLDLGPPEVEGSELVLSFKNASDAPLLMITTKARAINEDEGLAAGADAYLVKPFRPALLRKLINQLSPQQQSRTTKTRSSQHEHFTQPVSSPGTATGASAFQSPQESGWADSITGMSPTAITTAFIPVHNPASAALWYSETLDLEILTTNSSSAVLGPTSGTTSITLLGPESGIKVTPGLKWATCNFLVENLHEKHSALQRLEIKPPMSKDHRRSVCSSHFKTRMETPCC